MRSWLNLPLLRKFTMPDTTEIQEIKIDRQPDPATLQAMGVFSWPIWEKEVSVFFWTYHETETCYFLEGDVTVTPHGGQSVRLGKGDLATFPAGMNCTWRIYSAVKKHYAFR